MKSTHFSIQGHRGARGHYPENTVRGFLEAIRFGVNTIEMDVVISGDQRVVVSHEAWMNDLICSLPDGTPIKSGKGTDYNLFRMTYAKIKQFDCGKRGHPEFPMQSPLPAYKPLMSEVITEVEKDIKTNNRFPVTYNIELKTEEGDNIYNPEPKIFVNLVYREISEYLALDRINIQSFDVRLLKEMRKVNDQIAIGLLVENKEPLDVNLNRLGFVPTTYSPDFVLLNEDLVKSVHSKGMKLIPWTVNEIADMERLLALGVDGIITDYPDRLIKVINQK